MANKIQLRRGTKEQLVALGPLAVGEPGFTTDTNELFVGSSSGNVQIATSDEVRKGALAADRFRSVARDITKEQALILVGDSIGDGSNTNDFQNDSFMGIIRKSINIDYGNKNYGFESVGVAVGKNKYHVLDSFNFNLVLDGNYYGGNVAKSSISGAYLQTTFVGKDLKLVYAGRVDGGILNVTVDGNSWGTINTSIAGPHPNGTISAAITTSNWGQHIVRFTKSDTNPTDICGMMYYEDASLIQPIVHNVSRTGIAASQISDDMLDQYSENNMVIFALGVNDQMNNFSVDTFKSKVLRVASRVSSNKGNMLIVDFMYNSPPSSPYKKVLKDAATAYPQFGYLDFAEIWFGDSTKNIAAGLLDVDGLHPTSYGHEQIAQVILQRLNLPYSKRTVRYVPDSTYMPLTFSNGWSSFGVAGDAPAYKCEKNGRVYLRGILKPGTISTGVVMATLPAGRRPKQLKVLATSANSLATEIKINPDGTIQLSGPNGSGFVTLDNLSFELE